jgi:hypothetical protein
MVFELEDVVQLRVSKLCGRVTDSLRAGKPVDMHYAFRALSVDVATAYAFDRSYDLLSQRDFGRESFFGTIRSLLPQMWVFWMWPAYRKVAMNLPIWLARRLSRSVECMLKYIEVSPLSPGIGL